MCLLIAKPKGHSVPEKYLVHAAERNNQGLGVVWLDSGKLHIHKDPKTTPESIAKLVDVCGALKDHDALIHFRLATSGDKTYDNTHPMYIGPDEQLAMAHNGMIGQIATSSDASDTRNFADHMLAWLRPGWWKDPITVSQVEHLLHGDRMALLSVTDGIILLNPRSFTNEHGIEYSNSGFRPWQDIVSPYRTGSSTTPLSGHYYRGKGKRSWRSDDADYAPLHGGAQRALGAKLEKPPREYAASDFALSKKDTLVAFFLFGRSGDAPMYVCMECVTPQQKNFAVASPVLESELPFFSYELCGLCKRGMPECVDAELRRVEAAIANPPRTGDVLITEPPAAAATEVAENEGAKPSSVQREMQGLLPT